MKTTIYELLGLVKDGKAPKKIRYNDTEYYLYDRKSYLKTDNSRFFDSIYFKELTDEVEILEEEKKIPEKIILHTLSNNDSAYFTTLQDFNNRDIQKTINWILDYLKSKGE